MNLKRNLRRREETCQEENKNTSPQIHHTLGINLEDYAMDKFCRAHYGNHSEKTCSEFTNLFKAMILPRELQEEDEEEEKQEVEEEEEEEPSSNLHLI